MITSLKIENFKSWDSTGDIRFAPITAFFGTNSSGKTSILQSLLMLKQTTETPDRGLVLSFGDDPRGLADLGDFISVVNGHRDDVKLSWSLKWSMQDDLRIKDPADPDNFLFSGKEMGFDATVGLQTQDGSPASSIVVDKMEYGVQGHKFGMRRKPDGRPGYDLFHAGSDFAFVRTKGRPWQLPEPVKFYGFPDQVRAYYQNAGFLSDLELELERLFARVYYLGPLRASPLRQYPWSGTQPADMGRAGELAVSALLSSRERRELIALGRGRKSPTLESYVGDWLKKLGLVHSFDIVRLSKGSKLYEVHVKRGLNSPDVLITDVGFGVSQILPVIVLCFYVPEYSTIILEQPEIHLHPAVQADLADVLIEAATKWNVQIILESHSEHLLRRLQRRTAENTIKKEQIALYFCDHDGEKSKLTPLDLDVFGTIQNWPKNFFGDEFGEIAATTKAANDKKASGST